MSKVTKKPSDEKIVKHNNSSNISCTSSIRRSSTDNKIVAVNNLVSTSDSLLIVSNYIRQQADRMTTSVQRAKKGKQPYRT